MLTRKQKRVIILLTGKQNGGYVMNEKILDLLIRYFENQKMLEKIYKNESSNILNDYSISEMHCVDYIGKIDKPNVTKLSALLNVTRGGVSKIIKKLMKKGTVESFTSETNKKEIYYWNGNFKLAIVCSPAWSKEQCKLYSEEDFIALKDINDYK